MHTFRLTFDCPDQIGIVNQVSTLITKHKGWIADASQHSDDDTKWFFSRIEILADSLNVNLDEFTEILTPLAESLNFNWKIEDSTAPKKVIMMASKGSHCISDLLDRWHSGELNCEIPCVISNHDDMRGLVEHYGIPYHKVVIEKENKQPGFDEVERLIEEYQGDTIVLARYMQILPPTLCAKYQHKVINIHHSFLPSFIGAKPYHQASIRGVKLIGATCHYVTENLDQGPIIEQDVSRVNHRNKVEDLVRLGKDTEKLVLARGLRAHLEDRVLVHGNKTIVF